LLPGTGILIATSTCGVMPAQVALVYCGRRKRGPFAGLSIDD
jgi:hypothetical protein